MPFDYAKIENEMEERSEALIRSEFQTAVKRVGRPSEYTEEIADRICSAIADGLNLNRIASQDGFPSRECIYKWLRTHKSFSDNYARARESRADSRADRIDEITERVLSGDLDPHSARVAIDAIKWQAGKENPKRYGDRIEQQVTVTTTIEDVLSRRMQRIEGE